MKIVPLGALLMLFVVAAASTANHLARSQAPSAGGAAAISQSPAKPDAKASPRVTARKIPCKTPENASSCYWTRGRLSFYSNFPPLRIWKIGTDRILAVYSGPSKFPVPNAHQLSLPDLPGNLAHIYEVRGNWEEPEPLLDSSVYWSKSIFADFELCPLAPERKRKMQPVCVEQANNIFVEK